MKEAKTCPITGTTNTQEVFQVKDFTVTGEFFSVYQTKGFKYRFTHSVPSPDEIGRYYESEDYVSHSEKKVGLINRLFHWARLYTMWYKKRAVQKNTRKKEGNLLDYGCGTGDFLLTMKRAGWQVSGYEPDQKAASVAEEKSHSSISCELSSFSGKQSQYDAITLWHVLEHAYEPSETIEELLKLLKPGGILFFALPNYDSPDAEYYQEFWAGYDVPRHIHHFTPESFQYLAQKSNLTVARLQRMHLDGFYVSLLSEKYMGKKGSTLRAVWMGLKSWLISLMKKQRGSSVLYVCRRAH